MAATFRITTLEKSETSGKKANFCFRALIEGPSEAVDLLSLVIKRSATV